MISIEGDVVTHGKVTSGALGWYFLAVFPISTDEGIQIGSACSAQLFIGMMKTKHFPKHELHLGEPATKNAEWD